MRRLSVALAILLLVPSIPPVWGAAGNPGDVTGSDPLVGDVLWTGAQKLTRGVTITPGATLRIENATVTFHTTDKTHFGIEVQAGGRLVVRDSVLTNNWTQLSPLERTMRYWNLHSEGVVDIERSLLEHGADLTLERDATTGSRIVDTEFSWMSRGIHVLRTNVTGHDGWDLELRRVSIHDLPNVGGGTVDIGGAIGVLNGNVLIEDVIIERVRSTGLFVDRSAAADSTRLLGNRVEATGLVIVGGSPEGFTGEGKLLEIRTVGKFSCERCTFLPQVSAAVLVRDGDDFTLRDTTFVNALVSIDMPRNYPAIFDHVRMLGPLSHIVYEYGNQGSPTWTDLTLDPASTRGVYVKDRVAQVMQGAWWGHPDGPRDIDPDDQSTPTTNDGGGALVTGPVDYSGWRTAAPSAAGILRVVLDAAPPFTRPGVETSVPFTVENTGDIPLAITLRTLGPLDATLSLESMTLAAHGVVSGTLTYVIAPGVAAGTPIHEAVFAETTGAHAVDAITTVAAVERPTVRIDTPDAYALVDGDLTITGQITEPLPAPNVPASTTGGSGLGALDADGDRIDDRLQGAPGLASVLVGHDGEHEADTRAAIEAAGGTVLRAFDIIPFVWAVVDTDTLSTLAATPGVRAIWWDEPIDPQLASASRAVRARTSLDGILPGGAAVTAGYTGVWSGNPRDGYDGPIGRGVLMAVIDGGIDPTHLSIDDMDDDPTTVDPKIAGRISTFSILATSGAQLAPSSIVTPSSHGTMVSGTAAGTGQAFIGSPEAPLSTTSPEDPWLHAGVAPGARVLDVDAFEDTPLGALNLGPAVVAPSAGFGLALEGFQAVANWNIQHPEEPVRIIQISLGIPTTAAEHPLNDAANAVADTGVLVVVASGNTDDGVIVPASAAKVLAVGATDMAGTVSRGDDFRARFSDTANEEQMAAGLRKPELMAPGVSLVMPAFGTVNGYTVDGKDGTSFAAPLVSGIAALMLEANPDLHAAQLKELLIRSSEPRGTATGDLYTDVNLDFLDDIDDGGWDRSWGFGYVDAEEAVRLARATAPRLPPAPPLLTLHADEGILTETTPGTRGVVISSGTWVSTQGAGLVLGDADAATRDTVTLILATPTADPEPSVTTFDVVLTVDGETVARTTYVDNSLRLATTPADTRILLYLGQDVLINESGPDAGRIQLRDTLNVLDDQGALLVPAGATLALSIEATHPEGAPVPILTGPGGTRIILPIDPVTLPNTQPPTEVRGLRGTAENGGVTLTWGPAGDDHGIRSYQIFRDGDLLATVSASHLTHQDAGVMPLTTPRYEVRAIDIHGEPGPLSAPIDVTLPAPIGRTLIVDVAGEAVRASDLAGDGSFAMWYADLATGRVGRHVLRATLYEDGDLIHATTRAVNVIRAANLPPAVTLDAIGGVLHGARMITYSVADPNGLDDITEVRFRIDAGAWTLAAANAFVLDARTLTDGGHTLDVRATDQRGAMGIASAPFESQAWTGALHAPTVLLAQTNTEIRLTLAGANTASAAPTLHVNDAQFPMSPDADGWVAQITGLAPGLARLEAQSGGDLLAQTSRVVDTPPTAGILGPSEATRLDRVTLQDASTDDGGIIHREWQLPDGTTATTPTLVLQPGALPVGTYAITLTVSNPNGLTTTATHALTINNLAPRVTIHAPQVLGKDTTHTYAGETIQLVIDIDDPENDAYTVNGAVQDGALSHGIGPGTTRLTVRPAEPGAIRIDVSATDAWDTTTSALVLDVLPNTAPTARLTAPATTDAGKPITLDGTLSSDPDRGYLEHEQTILGLDTTHAAKTTRALPMGTWTVEHTVTDSSGAAHTATRTIQSDDWMTTTAQIIPPNGITGIAALVLQTHWHDGTPVTGGDIEVTIASDLLPQLTTRTIRATLDDDGTATLLLGRDLSRINLPGQHTVHIEIQHDSQPDAPIQDIERVTSTAHYLV